MTKEEFIIQLHKNPLYKNIRIGVRESKIKPSLQEQLSETVRFMGDLSFMNIIRSELEDPTVSLEIRCPVCQKERVFFPTNSKVHYRSGTANSNSYDGILQRIIYHEYTCSKAEFHKLYFFFGDTGEDIIKIGQYPSYADIDARPFSKYKSIIPDNYIAELNKAVGLRAHGIGIGSFVYLRRTFEYLVQQALLQAKSEYGESWSDEEFKKLRGMSEKIEFLSSYLPPFLVQEKKIYGILSKGIHELLEKECLDNFYDLQMAIDEILYELKVKKEREERKTLISRKLADNERKILNKGDGKVK